MVYVTGDTHGDPERLSKSALKALKDGDTLIICGDFGFIWNNSRAEKRILKSLSKRHYNICFIDGTHENFDILNAYPVTNWNGGNVHRISDNIYHLMRGQIFTIDGLKIFTMGGGESADLDSRLEDNPWLKYEIPSKEELLEGANNLEKANCKIEVKYSNLTGEWNIQGKSADKGVKATNTYGTSRISAYKIIEDSLNLRDVRIFDYIYDENGNKVAKLNIKETTIAQQKQASIKQAFEDWIWKDTDRRDDLCKIYNVRFNSIRPREYDGSHITFNGINPEIALRKHQKDAVARIMYGGNSLLGHVVGAGKTWTMVAAAMESRRLGLCNKSLFVVPNHLTEQWASEFLQLYPAANILVATKKDFEMKNRKKFCGRIATGDYDAVIIGHSQFEKIPMSAERQKTILQNQLDEIINGIIEAKTENAERYTVKQMEKTKRGLEAKIKKLNDQERKDDVVTFEEIGVDRVFVDEGHYYKNRAKRCA